MCALPQCYNHYPNCTQDEHSLGQEGFSGNEIEGSERRQDVAAEVHRVEVDVLRQHEDAADEDVQLGLDDRRERDGVVFGGRKCQHVAEEVFEAFLDLGLEDELGIEQRVDLVAVVQRPAQAGDGLK